MQENSENVQAIDLKQGNGALWTIAGTAIAQTANSLLQRGGLGGLFGAPPPGGPGAPVSREVADLLVENARLKADAHADRLNAAQMVVNAEQQGRIDCLQRQVDQLFSLTRLVVPNANLNPGVGPVAVVPVPPPVTTPAPDVTAIVQAVLAAQAAGKTAQQGQNG